MHPVMDAHLVPAPSWAHIWYLPAAGQEPGAGGAVIYSRVWAFRIFPPRPPLQAKNQAVVESSSMKGKMHSSLW